MVQAANGAVGEAVSCHPVERVAPAGYGHRAAVAEHQVQLCGFLYSRPSGKVGDADNGVTDEVGDGCGVAAGAFRIEPVVGHAGEQPVEDQLTVGVPAPLCQKSGRGLGHEPGRDGFECGHCAVVRERPRPMGEGVCVRRGGVTDGGGANVGDDGFGRHRFGHVRESQVFMGSSGAFLNDPLVVGVVRNSPAVAVGDTSLIHPAL